MSALFDKRVPTAEELFDRVKNNKANVSKHPCKDWNISKITTCGHLLFSPRQLRPPHGQRQYTCL